MSAPRTPAVANLERVRDDLRARGRRALNRIGGRVFRAMDDTYAAASRIPVAPVLDPSLFEWVPRLEAQTERIACELERLLVDHGALPRFQDISPNQRRISPGDDWRTFFFRGFGHDSAVAAELCPETHRVLAEIPGLQTAFFSILEPGTSIPSHRGVSRGLVRCHLPLLVPREREACFMDIGETRIVWTRGEAVLFDDTYRHAVHNDTSERRVVLLLDVERPMHLRGRLLLGASLGLLGATHYVRDGLLNQARWERDVAARLVARRRQAEPADDGLSYGGR